MPDKEFKTIEEQINILKERGLKISNETEAADFLKYNNYFRISGYSLTLRNHDVFSKNSEFQNIMDIYNFDYELRHILLKYLEMIEVRFKSVYAYEFTKIHSATGYLDKNNFTNLDIYTKLTNKAEEQKNKRHPHEAYLKHFIDDLNQPLPLWAYVDLLTIADISRLFSITETNIQREIASNFNLTHKVLGKFMHSMTIVRNLCAHGSRLYNRLFEQKPKLNKSERSLLRKSKKGTADDAHLFSFILVMKRLITPDAFYTMKKEIEELNLKYPFVNMKYYGFNDRWKDLL